eukprot:jgi/Bigna1/67541/fgenesh1_pg.4_\
MVPVSPANSFPNIPPRSVGFKVKLAKKTDPHWFHRNRSPPSFADIETKDGLKVRIKMPKCLDDFELIEHLQSTAHFDSYHAMLKDSSVPIEAIVKVVKKSYMKAFRRQVKKDNMMQHKIGQHENLMYSKWVGPDRQGRIWKARQFCKGGPVMRLRALSDGQLKEAYIAYILHETLKALAHLHKNKFTHTSVKPSNILLTENFDVKLTDPWVRVPLKHRKSRKGRSQTMVEFHNPLWTPPEEGDIWSLGLCALQLATGTVPDAGKPVWKIAWTRVMSPPPTLADTEEHHWSGAFKDFLSQCLIKDPKQRPTSLELMKHRFMDLRNWGGIAGVMSRGSSMEHIPQIEELRKNGSVTAQR